MLVIACLSIRINVCIATIPNICIQTSLETQEPKMEEVCRICKSNSVTLVNIFAKREQRKDEPPLADILNECGNCEIIQNDFLPQNICLSCILSAQDAFRFKRRCEESHQYFCQVLKMKSEVIIPEECPPTENPLSKDCNKKEPLEINDVEIFEDATKLKPDTNKSHIKKKHVCLTCGKAFNFKYDLTNHNRCHTVERPYKCIHCPMAFKDSTSFEAHRRLHTGVRPYKCLQCTATFVRSDLFEIHLLYHTGELAHECPHCSMRFTQLSSLTRHIRMHNDPLAHKCLKCSSVFAKKTELRKHAYTHRKGK